MEEVRVHGFHWPLHPLQVVSWIVFGTDVLVYLIFCIPMIKTMEAQIGVTSCFAISVISLVVSTFLATKCDPMDPFVLRDESLFNEEELEELPYCGLCATTVQARSKHCRVCKKCVHAFDHHCMWLNNCIGGDNYRPFFVSISSVAVMIGIVLGTILYQIIDFATNEAEFDLRMEASAIHADMSREAFLVILIALSVVNVPLWVLDMQLVLLHTYLVHQNLTTYEYITNKREDSGPGRRFKGLPNWMDWIVFSRCGQRRKKKKPPETAEAKAVEAEGAAERNPAEALPGSTEEAPPDRPERCDEPETDVEPTGPVVPEAAHSPVGLLVPDLRPADLSKDEVDACEPPAPSGAAPSMGCGCDVVSAVSNRDTAGQAAV